MSSAASGQAPAHLMRLNELAQIVQQMEGSSHDALRNCASVKALDGPDLYDRVHNIRSQLASLVADLIEMGASPEALADKLASEIEAVNTALDPLQEQLIDLLGQCRMRADEQGHVIGEWRVTNPPPPETATITLSFEAPCSKCGRVIRASTGLMAQAAERGRAHFGPCEPA